MKNIMLKILVCLTMMMLFSACNSAPTVNINEYVTVTETGYDGYGTVRAHVNYSKLIEDYSDRLSDNLDSQYFGDMTATVAAEFIFSSYDPYVLAYEVKNNMNNGDIVEFSWNTSKSGIDMLSEVLNIKIESKDFSYTVNNLDALEEIDPFENIELEYYGNLSGRATVSDYNKIEISRGDEILCLEFDVQNDESVSNGDVVRVCLRDYDENSARKCAEKYGVILSRTESEVIVKNLDYYAQEDPDEIFNYISEESFSNIQSALNEAYKNYVGTLSFEYVGAVYYYNEKIDFDPLGDSNNFLGLIYHIENGIYPGGWYTYIGSRDDVVVGQRMQDDGSILKTTVVLGCMENALYDKLGNYCYEIATGPWGRETFPQQFTYDGLWYAGHKSLEECIEALDYNEISHAKNVFGQEMEIEYDHLIVTDTLAQFVNEY